HVLELAVHGDVQHLDAAHHDVLEVDTAEFGARQVDVTELRVGELAPREAGATEIGIEEIGHAAMLPGRRVWAQGLPNRLPSPARADHRASTALEPSTSPRMSA